MSYRTTSTAFKFSTSSLIYTLYALLSTLYILPSPAQQTYKNWLKQDQQELTAYEAKVTEAYGKYLEEETAAFNAFVNTAGKTWGKDNVWIPEKTTWVQYREDWEERSSVQFEDGTAKIEVIVSENATEDEISKAIADAVKSLLLSGSISPIEMMRHKLFPSHYPPPTARDQKSEVSGQRSETSDQKSEVRGQRSEIGNQHPEPSTQNSVPTTNQRPIGNPMPPPYIVKPGDSLWKLARRFDVTRKKIAIINAISPDSGLRIGQEIYIPYKTNPTKISQTPKNAQRRDAAPLAGLAGGPRLAGRKQLQPACIAARSTAGRPRGAHHPEADPRLAAKGSDPLLHRQLKMPDGTEVTSNNTRPFAEHIAATKKRTRTTVTGSDGKQRNTIKTQFPLVPNHVRIRAERFRPLVTEYARKEGVYAPMVYAIMHSESSFNPRARSGVPAYGLMQLVPRSGARDAYRYVHKKDKLVSGSYLYNPENNIELGIAFLHILDQRYFRRVENPMNRMLCSIAAYNTGAGNVCKAFGAGKSLSRAAPIINRMQPTEVYAQLQNDLPYAETRHYIKKVTDRIPLYKAWK